MIDDLWRVGSLVSPGLRRWLVPFVAAGLMLVACSDAEPSASNSGTGSESVAAVAGSEVDPDPISTAAADGSPQEAKSVVGVQVGTDPAVGSPPASSAVSPSPDATVATQTPDSTTSDPATAPTSDQPDPTPSATTDPSTGTQPPQTAAPSTSAQPPATTRAPGPGDAVVGDGTPAGCTGRAVVRAVAAGGTIRFDCGPAPVTIAMDETAKVVNANGPEIVIDGGGLVTLDGQGRHRILYMNTCDEAQGWTTSHCQNQDHPRLTVQNLSFVNGNATGADPGGGGAIFVRGGRLRVANATFDGNRCDRTGPDVGGAAIRVLSQYQGLPVEVTGSTFRNGTCSNGGAISSIGVSWIIRDSTMTGNNAIGRGANPAKAGTPGGGSGGAIYMDGNQITLELRNSTIESNRAAEGGGAVFFVSNDRTGTMRIEGSTLSDNPSDGFETSGFPGIFFLGSGTPAVADSSVR